MPLPIIFALAGALLGAGFGMFGGAKLGSWLKGNLSDEEQQAVARTAQKFGLHSEADAEKLPGDKKEQLVKELDAIRSKSKKS